MRSARWLALSLLLSGCPDAVTIAPPSVGDPNAPTRPVPIAGPRRPSFVEAFRFDYGALPLLAKSTRIPSGADASLVVVQGTSNVEVDKDLVVELDGGATRSFSAAPWPIAPTSDPSIQQVPPFQCMTSVGGAGGEPIKWDGLRVSTRTSQTVDFLHFEGFLDRGSCRATATQSSSVRAPAILEGVLYGFRTCVEGCELTVGDPKRVEYLVVLGPRADWVGSSAPWNDLQTRPHVGPFSRLYVPVRRGASSTVALHVSASNVDGFAIGGKKDAWLHGLERAELVLELVWPAGDPGPSASGRVNLVEKPGAGVPSSSLPPPG